LKTRAATERASDDNNTNFLLRKELDGAIANKILYDSMYHRLFTKSDTTFVFAIVFVHH